MAHLQQQQSSSPVTFCNSHAVLMKYTSGCFLAPLRPSTPCFGCSCRPAVNEHPVRPPRLSVPLRVSVAPPLPPIWMIFFTPSSLSHTHTLTHSLSLLHCIHFCAFKKSPRITNLAESELTEVTGGLRTTNENKQGRTGHAFLN